MIVPTKPRYWLDTEKSLRTEYGDKLDVSNLYLGFRRAYLSGDKHRVALIEDGEVKEVREGTIMMSEGPKPVFLIVHRPTRQWLSNHPITPRHLVVAEYYKPKKVWITIVRCGEGHYGTKPSDCTFQLGHEGDCNGE